MLNAGNFGVSQSRKRTFIWAAAPGETLPEWPRPLTVFKSPQLCINLPGGVAYHAVKDGKHARLRAVTVRDAIGDLPAISNGEERYFVFQSIALLLYAIILLQMSFVSTEALGHMTVIQLLASKKTFVAPRLTFRITFARQ